MQQAPDPLANLALFTSGGTTSDNTNNVDLSLLLSSDDLKKKRKEILLKSGSKGDNKAVIKLTAKKGLFNRILELKDAINADINTIDPNTRSDTGTKFHAIFGKRGPLSSGNKIKGITNEDASAQILVLNDIFAIIDNELKEQADAQRATTRVTRRQSEVELTSTQKLYQEVMGIVNDVDVRIRTALNNPGNESVLKGLTIPQSMQGRTFLSSRVPTDPALRTCAFCGCQSTNTVPEDDGLLDRNSAKYDRLQKETEIWNKFKKLKDAYDADTTGTLDKPDYPLNPFNENKPMRRAPSAVGAKQLESQRLYCACLWSCCLQEGSNVGSTCISKCRKREEGDTRHAMALAGDSTLARYEWEGIPRRCTCPQCKCQCNMLYHISDIPKIALAKHQKNLRDIQSRENGGNPQAQLGQFLGQAMAAGNVALQQISQIQESRGVEVSAQVRQELFNDGMAEHVVRQGGSLPSGVIQLMQQHFGRSTDVTLPSGNRLNTRVITGNNNAHVRNNRIAGASTEGASFAPGMDDNLNPSFSNPSGDFTRAAMNPNNLANTIRNITPSTNAVGTTSTSTAAASTTSTSTAAASSNAIGNMSFADQMELALRRSMGGNASESTGGNTSREPIYLLSDDDNGKPKAKSPEELATDSAAAAASRAASDRFRAASGSSSRSNGGNGHPKLNIFERSPSKQPSTKQRKSGMQRIWDRTKGRNAKEKHMDTEKDDLTAVQKKQRKRAKKTSKSMAKRDNSYENVVAEMLASDGVALSQATAYERGSVSNQKGSRFYSQDALKKYRNGVETDSEDDD